MDLRDAIQRIALEWPSYGRELRNVAVERYSKTQITKALEHLPDESVIDGEVVALDHSGGTASCGPLVNRKIVFTG